MLKLLLVCALVSLTIAKNPFSKKKLNDRTKSSLKIAFYKSIYPSSDKDYTPFYRKSEQYADADFKFDLHNYGDSFTSAPPMNFLVNFTGSMQLYDIQLANVFGINDDQKIKYSLLEESGKKILIAFENPHDRRKKIDTKYFADQMREIDGTIKNLDVVLFVYWRKVNELNFVKLNNLTAKRSRFVFYQPKNKGKGVTIISDNKIQF